MKEQANQIAKKAQNVTDFLSNAVDALKGLNNFKEAIEKSVPWAESITDGIPFAKLAVKTVEELTKETNPLKLGLIACTIAYQNSVLLAIQKINTPIAKRLVHKEIKEQLRTIKSTDDVDISSISLQNPWSHEFFELANSNLLVAMRAVGYHDSEIEEALEIVRKEFKNSLKLVLTDNRFEPFKLYINLGASKDAEIKKQLLLHASYQLWLYKSAPVLGVLPFALEDVYVPNDCGILKWIQIKDGDNPFDEQNGGRHDLLNTVVNIINDDEYKEAIFIQGSAGTGKSSFTLKLYDELWKDGFHPIRIRIRDLNFSDSLDDALTKAVRFTDEVYKYPAPTTIDDLFNKKEIFNETVSEKLKNISKYVLILDGWDEINVADSNFKDKIRYMLERLKSEYLQRTPNVKVILTGRPTHDIAETNLLRDTTKILTIRNLYPPVLEEYIKNLAYVINSEEAQSKMIEGESWQIPHISQFNQIFKDYEKLFPGFTSDEVDDSDLLLDDNNQNKDNSLNASLLDVLGSPLLAFLSVRLISEWVSSTKTSVLSLIKNPTMLYRHLIDLTTSKAGKFELQLEKEESNQDKFFGNQLRNHLHKVAIAITVYGKENIPLKELAFRLNLDSRQLQEKAEFVEQKHKLSKLLISFFFRTGSHLGCEFQHKSFREYLFAEAIVEKLKEYGRNQGNRGFIPDERKSYWKDFADDDLRYNFSRDILDLIASEPLTFEVYIYLEKLIEWEVLRSLRIETNKIGLPTLPLKWEEWLLIRTVLCDLWDWWASGVHLRPQKVLVDKRRGNYDVIPPYTHDLATFLLTQEDEYSLPVYESSQVLDSTIGENLFILNSLIHGYLASFTRAGNQENISIRKYQSSISRRNQICFKPSINKRDFQKFMFRINTNYGIMTFPKNISMIYIDLSETDLSNMNFENSNLTNGNFRDSDLTNANFNGANLTNAKLSPILLDNASLNDAHISCDGIWSEDLQRANFDYLFLDGEKFNKKTVLKLLTEKDELRRRTFF